jgi:hypothetical protein
MRGNFISKFQATPDTHIVTETSASSTPHANFLGAPHRILMIDAWDSVRLSFGQPTGSQLNANTR